MVHRMVTSIPTSTVEYKKLIDFGDGYYTLFNEPKIQLLDTNVVIADVNFYCKDDVYYIAAEYNYIAMVRVFDKVKYRKLPNNSYTGRVLIYSMQLTINFIDQPKRHYDALYADTRNIKYIRNPNLTEDQWIDLIEANFDICSILNYTTDNIIETIKDHPNFCFKKLPTHVQNAIKPAEKTAVSIILSSESKL